VKEYPVIISELIKGAKSDKSKHFNLSSFMSDKPFEDVFEKIDRAMNFFSVYVFMEPLEDDLWEYSRYAEKESVLLNSEKPIPTYFFTYDSHNHFIFNRKEKCLCLNIVDLVGNFHIDWKESKRILKDVKRIEDSGILA
jgi:hypothetical protein